MTIFDLLFCVGISLLFGFTSCYLQFVMPLQASRSRLIGKLNQKEWQITEWQLAYNKANNDFMKLAEIHNSAIKPEGELIPDNNCGWIEWTWTEDKPYPETLETMVAVMFRDGTCATHHTDTVEWWYSEIIDANNWYNSGDSSDIVAYRVVN